MTEQQQTNEQINQQLSRIIAGSVGLLLDDLLFIEVRFKADVLMLSHREQRRIQNYVVVCDARNNPLESLRQNQLGVDVAWIGLDGIEYHWSNPPRCLQQYKVICDETSNPPQLADQNQLHVDIVLTTKR